MVTFLKAWRRFYWHSRWVFLIVLVVAVWGWSKSSLLPPPAALSIDFKAHPVQEETSTPNFRFEWRGSGYLVYPVADYYIRGLVVSHNNVGGITDAYHARDAVDLKDICLVWGENARTGAYQHAQFWSEPWTCNYRFKGSVQRFNSNELSNNHLLAGTEQVAQLIRETRIGDQIELSGFLVNYAPEKSPQSIRKTSLIRDDTGDGACEVVFVTEYRIVQKANESSRSITQTASRGLIGMLLLFALSWTALPYLEYRNGL